MAKNTFRFSGFSEKISRIKIDVYHKIGEVRELSETTEDTYLKEALIKWRDLNCSKDFVNFRNEIWRKVQDLRQIVYHQDEIIKTICKHLLVKNSQCLDALLDLVAQIAKDLRNEFYQHFAEIFEVIIKLLNVHDAELVEQIFTCMAYIFKYCWRYMIPEYDKVYGMYKKLLHTSQKPHVRQFAAESISFLVRKIDDKDGFLDTVFISAAEDCSLIEGIGCLLFEIIKGVCSKFQSCTKEVIQILLKKLEPNYQSNVMVFECVSLMFKLATKYTKQEHVHVLWECLLSETMCTNQSLHKEIMTFGVSNCEKVNYLLKLLKLIVEWKSGEMLFHFWDEFLKVVEDILKPEPLKDVADTLLELLSSLLQINIPEMKKDYLKKIVKQIFSNHFSTEQIALFVCSVRDCHSFEEVVLTSFYQYARSVLLSEERLSSEKASVLLKLLCENITEKTHLFRIPYDSVVNEQHLVCFYGHGKHKESTGEVGKITDKMLGIIEECGQQEIESADSLHLMNVAHSCVVCLPFLRPVAANRALPCLIDSVKNWIGIAETANLENSSMLLFIISQAMQSICLLQNDKDVLKFTDLQYESMFSLLSRFPRNILMLGAYDCYCRMFSCHNRDQLSAERFEQVYSLLKYNLSSNHPIIRLLTLRILSYYKQPCVEDAATVKASDSKLNVIGECLTAEEIPATFERYLEKLMHLRKLTFTAIQQLPQTQFYSDVIIRFLIGNLFINLRPMWEPVMDILQTFAHEENVNQFWSVYSLLIKSAFAAKADQEGDNSTDIADTIDVLKGDNPEMQLIKNKRLVHMKDSLNIVDESTVCLLMCQSMEKFPNVVERKSRDVLPLFFEFLSKEYEKFDTTLVVHQNILKVKTKDHPMTKESENEDETEQLNENEKSSKPSNLSYQKKKILISFLRLFSKFKNPKALYMEKRLHHLYLELLCHHDSEIQALAFSCLKTYKFPYLKPYEENFEKIFQDNTFKDELTLFASGSEKGIVKSEHRTEVMKVILRILFGRLQRRSGLGVSGKKNHNVRRNILINFISNCSENDVDIFIGLVTEPFRELLLRDDTQDSHPNLNKMIPLRKQLGYLNMLKTILKRLSSSVEKHVSDLLTILLEILDISVSCLAQREIVDSFCVGQLKSTRQIALARLVDFLEIFIEMDFTCFSDKIFKCAVMPQIANMQQEAHQVTPLLRLLHCWSKYPKYHPWLERNLSEDGNDTVLHHVFSILKCPKKSAEVVQMVMSIAENLLQTNSENGEMESGSQSMIIKYLDMLFVHLSEVIKSPKASKASNRKDTFQMELNILAQISLFVKEPEQCQTVINILFPTLKTTKHENVQINTLKTVKNLLENSRTSTLPLGSLSMLFVSLKGKLSRTLLCDIFEVVAERNEELAIKGFVHHMNSWDSKRIEEPDYERRLQAFADFSELLQSETISSRNIKPLLCNCIHFSLESNDISIRDSSLSCIGHTIDFVVKNPEFFDDLIQGLLLSHVKSAIRSKSEVVRSEYIQILSMIVKKFDETTLTDMKALTSTDPEMDFFENIRHIQNHRRIKAIRQLAMCTNEGKLQLNSLYHFLLPMISHFIFEHALAKEHNIVSETITAVGCITGCLTWQKYSHVLKSYLRLLSKEQTKQKTVLRIVVAILNSFPFNLSVLDEDKQTESCNSNANYSSFVSSDTKKNHPSDAKQCDNSIDVEMKEAVEKKEDDGDDSNDEDEDMNSNEIANSAEEAKNDQIVFAKKIHKAISSNILPLLHNSLTQKSFVENFHRKSHNKEIDNEEILRVPLALAMTKLLQQLPKSTLHDFLPGLLLRVCQSLKSRARDVRETARNTLVKMASSLGPTYLPYVLREMVSVLKRGYQLHVLSYTMKAVLDGLSDQLAAGDLDECLNKILQVLMNDIFSNVAEEKESEGIKENLHEAKSKQSYDSFEIIAKFASASSFEDIVNAIQRLLETEHVHTVRNKAKEVLRRISVGFQKNSSLSQKDLLIFIYRKLVDSKQLDESNIKERKPRSTNDTIVAEDIFLIKTEPGRMTQTADRDKSANSHLITEFGLQLLFSLLKRCRQQSLKQDILELLDPFVEALIGCLKSKYNQVVYLGTKSLSLIVHLPLPSVSKNINSLSALLFKLLKKYGRIKTGTDENRELIASAFKAMTVLLRNGKKCKVSEDQLKTLLLFVEEDIYDHTRHGTAFPLLKAILSRKLDVSEIHEVMEKIGDLSVTSDSQSVQLQCRQIMLQYLLDYPLGKKSEMYLEFYVNQLEYEWENGRQSALEMIALIFKHFPQKRLQEYAAFFFVPLAMRLINDDSPLCRKLTIAVISSLMEKLDTEWRTELFGLVLNWLQQEKVSLKRLAIQIIGTFAEVEKHGFEKRVPELLPLIKEGLIFESDMMEEDDTTDQLIFFTLNTLKKIFQNCQAIRSSRIQEPLNEIWNVIQDLLRHPHTWIRLASCQLFGQLFAAWPTDEVVQISQKDAYKCIYLGKDLHSKVRQLCINFCEQLKDDVDTELGEQIAKNLIYLSKIINLLERQNLTTKKADLENIQSDEEDQNSKNLSLKWLLHKMSYLASHEASQSQNTSTKRTCVFRWLAAISVDLGNERIQQFLPEILQPLHRETVSSLLSDPELQKLAKEVISLIKEIVGKEIFAESYSKMQRKVTNKKESRKRKRLEEAIKDQEKFALKKQKRTASKQEQKRRKLMKKKF